MAYKTYNSGVSFLRAIGITFVVLFSLCVIFFAILGVASLINGISIPTIFGIKEVAETTAKITFNLL